MSQFRIGGTDYVSSAFDDLQDMNVKIGAVLKPKTKAGYEYDFGSTTELTIRALGDVDVPVEDDVDLLARNSLPDFRCATCDEPAAQLCTECMYDEDPLLCEKHAEEHEHEDMLLSVVYSPRMGVCGYEGLGRGRLGIGNSEPKH